MLCVFFSIVSCVFSMHLSSFKALSISSRCVMQLHVLFCFDLRPSPTHICYLFTFFKSTLLTIHLNTPPPIFLVITIMESSIHITFISKKTKPNRFYVGVGCLASCSNTNIVNRRKQEALFEAPFDIGTHDLTMQELLLKNLRKQANLWKLHQKTFHIWAFFKMNNNQLIDLRQSKIMRCAFFFGHSEISLY